MSSQSRHSVRAVPTNRSANALARDARKGVLITRAPIEEITSLKGPTNLASRSRIKNLTTRPSSSSVIARLRASGECECLEDGLPEPNRSGSLEAFIQKHGHVTEEYKFYNGTITLRFNKEDWRYFRVAELGNLLPVNGITNVVGIIDKSHMLTPWAAKMAIQKLLRIMPTEMVEGIIRIKPLTFEEFTVIALESKGAHKEKLDEACDIGHIAHKCLEDSINFALANDPEKIVRQLLNVPTDELAANAALSGFNWMQAHNVRWLETESKVYSLEHNYAGTMDGLCICDSCNDKAC